MTPEQPEADPSRVESPTQRGERPIEHVPSPPERMVTLRAVLIALLLTPLNAYWLVMMEMTRAQGFPTTISLFFNVIFCLLILIGLNAVAGRLSPKLRLQPAELLTVYILMAITSAMAGHDLTQVITPILAHAHHYARPENNWATLILPHIPHWLCVSDPRALEGYYNGTDTLYSAHNLAVWAVPVFWWTVLLVILCFMMLCMNTLLRKQWTESEKLAYPLVIIPIEMVNPTTSIWKSRLFWYGAALSAALQIYNGIAFLYPSVPSLPLKWNGAMSELNTYITTPPWNAIGWTPIAVYPFAIALGLLLPVDLLFSSWFFAWFWRAERVFGAMYGYSDIPGFPYVEAQSFGGYIGIALFALWVSRRHFIRIWRGLLNPKLDLQDAGEPVPYRWAALGLAAGCVGVFLFCRAAGMSPAVIAAFFLVYFALSIAITRIRAELGPPAHDLHMAGPDSMFPQLTDARHFRGSELAMFSMFYGFNRAYRCHPMPIQLEAFKMAGHSGAPERAGSRYRSLFWAMLLAIVVGSVCGFWANIEQCYRYGAAGKIGPPNIYLIYGSEAWNRMQGWLTVPPPPTQQHNTQIAVAVGIFMALALNALRLRFSWFPFHPVGYAVSSSWSMNMLWLPMLIAWAIKSLLLRYGGLASYRRALPFFLGLILGECVIGSLWTLAGIFLGIPTYAFWP
jgi:hypothetical protein